MPKDPLARKGELIVQDDFERTMVIQSSALPVDKVRAAVSGADTTASTASPCVAEEEFKAVSRRA